MPQVTVHSGDDLNQLVNEHSPGTEFHLQAGVYRLQSIIPRDGDAFIGEPGATLNGARILKDFTRAGGMWTAAVQATQLGEYRGKCFPSQPACALSEDLFRDDTPLLRVADKRDVGPGKWYLDYDAHKIYLGDDPQGHTVEISLTPYAIRGSASNVRVEGLTIEKYACQAGSGAVDGRAESGQLGHNWVVKNNIIRLNHGLGIRTGDGMQVSGNKLLQNGQMGIGGGGDNVVVDGNEIADNNYAGYNYGWEAGGSKFTFTHNLVVRNNYVHNNDGPGLWTDLENENTLYENNHTASNREAGILEEVSYHATIRNNTIQNDGFSDSGQAEPWYGGGILISDSSDVNVYGNTVVDCMNGIVGLQHQRELSGKGTPYLLENLNVHGNIITQRQGIAAGILRAGTLGDQVFLSRNNRFTDNQFHLGDPQAKSFTWNEAHLTYGEWEKIWK